MGHDCYVEMHEDSSASNVASTISIEHPSLTIFHADPIEPEAKRDSHLFKVASDDTSSTGLSDDLEGLDSETSSDTGYVDDESALHNQSELRQSNFQSVTVAHQRLPKVPKRKKEKKAAEKAGQTDWARQVVQWQWSQMAQWQAMRMAQCQQ